jgi:hypothetical protein
MTHRGTSIVPRFPAEEPERQRDGAGNRAVARAPEPERVGHPAADDNGPTNAVDAEEGRGDAIDDPSVETSEGLAVPSDDPSKFKRIINLHQGYCFARTLGSPSRSTSAFSKTVRRIATAESHAGISERRCQYYPGPRGQRLRQGAAESKD